MGQPKRNQKSRRSLPRQQGIVQKPVHKKEPASLARAFDWMMQGKIAPAQTELQRFTEAHPQNAEGWIGLADCHDRLGNIVPSIHAATQAVGLQPDNAQYITFFADALFKNGQCDESLQAALRATTLDVDNVNAHCLIARNLELMQRMAEAQEHLEAQLEEHPADPYLLTTLAHMEARQSQTTNARSHLQDALAIPNIPEEMRILALHELGSLLDRSGEHSDAFTAFEECGEATLASARVHAFAPQQRIQQIAAYKNGFTIENVAAIVADQAKADKVQSPAFLVGFPRSGTTMLEQMLASHTGIATSNEQPILNNVRQEWMQHFRPADDVGQMIRSTSPQLIRKLRASYWKHVQALADSNPSGGLFIDKLPLNIIELGFIRMIFPEARVLVALRDPRDVCLSCFFQNFRLNSSMIHFLTLERTVRFYTLVMGLYLRWREIDIAGDCLEVRYEDTVNDFECQCRRVLKYLDIEWEPGVLDFHDRARERYITTPSYTSVTEKVHRRAVQRWRKYQSQFAPHTAALQPFIDAFEYQPQQNVDQAK